MNKRPAPLLLGDKPLPHGKEVEAAVLSCFVVHADLTLHDIDRIGPTDFYIPAHRRIYETICDIKKSGKTVEPITLISALEQKGILEDIGGTDGLRKIYNATPSAANFNQHIQEVMEFGRARRLINLCSEYAGKAFEAEQSTLSALISDAERDMLEISHDASDTEVSYMTTYFEAAVNDIWGTYRQDPNSKGLSTGFHSVDRLVKGMKKGEMIVIAARPSIGKTTFALNLAYYMTTRNGPSHIPGGMISFEMEGKILTQKYICMLGGINYECVSNGSIAELTLANCINIAKSWADVLPIIIDDKCGNFEEVKHRCRSMVRKDGAQYIVIDYLQLMRLASRNKNDSREQEVTKMSGDLKNLALELKVPIIVLAQLNRSAEGEPKMKHLRESGSIEQDADIVMLLHRDRETDDPELAKKVASGYPIQTSVIVPKNRNGPTGIAYIDFFPQCSQFHDKNRVADNDVPQ